MSKRNEPIGTVECPTKGCSEQCKVYRFRERGESEKSVANRRFAGKLYGRCPRHGRFGGDAGDDAMQEYIECHAKKLGAEGAGADRRSPASAPATAPAKQTRPPASSPAPQASSSSSSPAPTPAKKRSGFGFFGWGDE